MGDARSTPDATAQLAQLQRDFDDFRTTALARFSRPSVGAIEATLVTTPPAGAIFLNGSNQPRASYPGLWKWVQDNGLITAGLFTVGDGSTTFGLPDFRGRVLVAAGTLGSDTYVPGQTSGAARVTIATANMPAHSHNVTVSQIGTHSHVLNTGEAGGHGGHFPTSQFNAAAGADLGLAAWNSTGTGSATHHHSGGVQSDGAHAHANTEDLIGSGTPIDARPPTICVNWQIWT